MFSVVIIANNLLHLLLHLLLLRPHPKVQSLSRRCPTRETGASASRSRTTVWETVTTSSREKARGKKEICKVVRKDSAPRNSSASRTTNRIPIHHSVSAVTPLRKSKKSRNDSVTSSARSFNSIQSKLSTPSTSNCISLFFCAADNW